MYEPRADIVENTEHPVLQIKIVASQCTNIEPKQIKAADFIPILYKSGHHSPLEFAWATMHIRNISRAALAQITRHRHFSFMSSSQHYQDYSDYPLVCQDGLVKDYAQKSIEHYINLLELGIPKEEARMVLPNASGVSLYMAGNARAWMEFLHKRLCRRNVQEMQILAGRIHTKLIGWFPQLFKLVNAPCEDEYLRGCRELKPCGENGEA